MENKRLLKLRKVEEEEAYEMESIPNFLIIGGGLAGLYCAYQLLKIHPMASITIVEKEAQLGGRVLWKEDFCGKECIDGGAQWVGPQQTELIEVLNEFDLELYPQRSSGKPILEMENKAITYEGSLSRIEAFSVSLKGYSDFMREYFSRSYQLPTEEIHMTLEEWTVKSKVKCSLIQQLFFLVVETAFSQDPQHINIQHFFSYLSRCQSWKLMCLTEGGAQESKVKGGASQLIKKLHSHLNTKKVNILTSEKVVQIHFKEKEEKVHITLNSGKDITADYCICAIPPSQLHPITFSPPLPSPLKHFISRCQAGSVAKFMLAFRTDFWTKAGLSGEFMCHSGPLSFGFHHNLPDQSLNCLVAYATGSRVAQLPKNPLDRKQVVIARIAQLFSAFCPEPESVLLRELVDFQEFLWPEKAYFDICEKAYEINFDRFSNQDYLAKSNIFFIGTEFASSWPGYMNGAINSCADVLLFFKNKYQK